MAIREEALAVALIVFSASWMITLLFGSVMAWKYRKAVGKLMVTEIEKENEGEVREESCTGSLSPPFLILQIAAIPTADEQVSGLAASAQARRRSSNYIYRLAGVAYAIVASILLLASSPTLKWGAKGTLYAGLTILVVCLWPSVFVHVTVLARGGRSRFMWVFVYFTLLFAAGLLLRLGGAAPTESGISPIFYGLVLWLAIMIIPTSAATIMLVRHIQPVAPIILAPAAVAMELLTFALRTSELSAVRILATFILSFLIACLIIFAMGKLYSVRKLSDQSLVLDAWWLLFTLGICIHLGIEWGVGGIAGLAAQAAFRTVAAFGFAVQPKTKKAPSLLILRVFNRRFQSDRFFRLLSDHWRHIGNVKVIAGTDVATTAWSVVDFLDFAIGRLRSRFIIDASSLSNRISSISSNPDPDGRYRVVQFFCLNNIWREVLNSLASTSDFVVMDLRGYSSNNCGCTFELHALVKRISLNRVILLIDGSTEKNDLRSALESACRNAGNQSPNTGKGDMFVQLFSAEQDSILDAERLMSLFEAPEEVHRTESRK